MSITTELGRETFELIRESNLRTLAFWESDARWKIEHAKSGRRFTLGMGLMFVFMGTLMTLVFWGFWGLLFTALIIFFVHKADQVHLLNLRLVRAQWEDAAAKLKQAQADPYYPFAKPEPIKVGND